jgi:hypothetical protein
MPSQFIDDKPWKHNRSNDAQGEAEAFMEAAKIVNGKLHGYQRWRTAEIVITDENYCHEDVADHVDWMLKLQREGDLPEGVRIVDKRSRR